MLGRRKEFDSRSRNYAIRLLLPAAPLRGRSWVCPARLDQGQDGACIGFGWSHELAADPVRVPVTNWSARALYHQAQLLDAYPDTPPAEGSSVLAGAKAVQAQGHMLEYRWAFGLDDVMATIAHYGPVVLGTDWHDSMMDPPPSGLLNVSGPIAGGHCYLARGLLMHPTFAKEPVIRCRQSWGASWGRNGDFFLRASDLDRLLQAEGEACVPVKRL